MAEPIYEAFVRAAVACARRVEINYPDIRKGFIGPFIPEKQADTVLEHIQDALNKGAKLHTAAEIVDHGGKWCLPTVLTDVDHSMQVMREESFGPLLPIMPFGTVDEAIGLANDSDYGLTASVYAGHSGGRRSGAGHSGRWGIGQQGGDIPDGAWYRAGRAQRLRHGQEPHGPRRHTPVCPQQGDHDLRRTGGRNRPALCGAGLYRQRINS